MDIVHKATSAIYEIDPSIDINLILSEYDNRDQVNGDILLMCSMYVGDNNFWERFFIKTIIQSTKIKKCDVIIALVEPSLYFVYISVENKNVKTKMPPHVEYAIAGTSRNRHIVKLKSAFKDVIDTLLSLF